MRHLLSHIRLNSALLGVKLSVFGLIAFLFGACVDNEIEGAATSNSSTTFKATKATSSFTTVNNCGTSTSIGTTFNVRIDLQGKELAYITEVRYKFSSQSSFSTTSLYTALQTGGSSQGTTSTFRQPVKSSSTTANYYTVTHCVRFGTSSSIEYQYDLTSESGVSSTISTVITRPASAQ
jgi:hypothetical protein